MVGSVTLAALVSAGDIKDGFLRRENRRLGWHKMKQTLVGAIFSLMSSICFAETWRCTAKAWDRETSDLLIPPHFSVTVFLEDLYVAEPHNVLRIYISRTYNFLGVSQPTGYVEVGLDIRRNNQKIASGTFDAPQISNLLGQGRINVNKSDGTVSIYADLSLNGKKRYSIIYGNCI